MHETIGELVGLVVSGFLGGSFLMWTAARLVLVQYRERIQQLEAGVETYKATLATAAHRIDDLKSQVKP